MKLRQKPVRTLSKDLKQVGERIEWVRCVLNYPFHSFANKLVTMKSTLENIVKHDADPTPEFLDRLCQIIPVRMRWLVTGDGEPFNVSDIEPLLFKGRKEKVVDIELALRIREVREDQQLALSIYASKLGLSKDQVAFIEQGRQRPDPSTLARICEVFDVTDAWILRGIGRKYARKAA